MGQEEVWQTLRREVVDFLGRFFFFVGIEDSELYGFLKVTTDCRPHARDMWNHACDCFYSFMSPLFCLYVVSALHDLQKYPLGPSDLHVFF